MSRKTRSSGSTRTHLHHPLVIVVTLPLVLLGGPQSATADEETSPLDGLPIVSIVFKRHNIFDTSDPKTSSWPYRAANSLHITSRERFLQSMLLFKEGDPYSRALADESARLLRSLGIINPVYITAVEVEGGVEVTVDTRDQWSLQVGADAGISGNRGSFGIQLQEENLVGWGKELTIAFDSDIERDTWGIRYRDPNIAGSRWTTELAYENRTDGSLKRIFLEHPFFALEIPRAWGGGWESEKITEYLYSQGESVVEGERNSEILRGWYGLRLGGPGRVTHRLTVGWDHRRSDYSDWRFTGSGDPYPTPEDLDISGPRIGYVRITDNYNVLTGFRAWSAQEDIALGPNLEIGVTFSDPAFGGDIRRVVFDGRWSAARHEGRWLLLGDGWFSGRIERGEARNVLVGVQAAASQIGDRGFQFRLLYEESQELDLDRQLTLGAEIGLRGWDPEYFDGTGRALFNAQYRRMLFRDVLQLFSVGGVVFVDAGRTWDPRVGPSTDGIRADAGVGLIFDLSRFSTSNIFRAEIAWPDDGSGYVISLTGAALF